MNILILRLNISHFIGVAGMMVLLLIATPGWAETGSEVSEMCTNYPEGNNKNLCELFVSLSVELVTSNDRDVNPKGRLCIDESTPLVELVLLVNGWFSKNPQYLSKNFYNTAHAAFSQVYQCE